jgi:uncharacterized protein
MDFLTAFAAGGMILRFSPRALSPYSTAFAWGWGQRHMASHKASRQRFDAVRLAREKGVVEGSVDPHRLSRVADMLSDGPASVVWRIEGTSDPAGRPALRIVLTGSVMLECQRCLDDFAWGFDVATDVLLAHDEAELAALDADSSLEVVLADSQLDPLALVEDELVLALPFAPRHADAACDSNMTTRRT